MTDGNVDGPRSIRRRPRISAGDPVDSDGKRVLVFLGQGLYATGERMLRDSDRRQIQSDSHITCDSEQGRVQPPVAVDHEHIGARGESSDRRLDSGELPIGEIGRDIRKVHPSSDESNLDRLEIRERDGSRGRVHLVTLIRHIDAGDDLDRPAIVVLDDLRSEPLLLCTKDPEEFDVRQGGDDSGFIDAAPGHGKALLTELLFGRGEDGPTVLANDPVAPPRVRMFHKPGRDPTRRSHVAERAGDCSACRHLPVRNFSEAFRNRLCEVRVHSRVRSRARKTFLRNGPSTDLRLPSSFAAV